MSAKALFVLAGIVSWVAGNTVAFADIPIDLPPGLEDRLWTIPIPGEKPGLEGIQLTQEQQEKIEQIQQETQAELEAHGLETPSAILEFPSLEEKVKQFDITELSTAQQATLAEITQSYRQKITEILTPSQHQQFLKKLPDLLFETP